MDEDTEKEKREKLGSERCHQYAGTGVLRLRRAQKLVRVKNSPITAGQERYRWIRLDQIKSSRHYPTFFGMQILLGAHKIIHQFWSTA